MAIKKFYSTKAKAGWRFDAARKEFWSYGFDIYLETGKRKRESGFATKDLASSAVARIKISEKEKTYSLQTRKFPMISEVLKKAVERITEVKPKKRAFLIFNLWLSLLPPDLRVSELSAALIRRYADERQSKVKASSVNREMTFIASALHSAYLDFPELETWNCPRIPYLKQAKSRRERLITNEEVLKILNFLFAPRLENECGPEARNRNRAGRVFHFALLTGARIGEIAALAWSQIDVSASIVQIVGMKTRFKQARNVRYLELTPAMRGIFAEQKAVDDFGDFVFSKSGNSITDYYSIIRAACENSGVKYGREVRGGMVTHDARHTAITKMIQAGIDLATIGSISGHSDAHLVLHYAHPTRESRKKAVEVLNLDFVRTKKKSQTA